MIKKLMKHEFLATMRVYLPIILTVILSTIVLDVAGYAFSMLEDNQRQSGLVFMFIMTFIGLILMIVFFVFISPYLFSAMRFYKTTATDEAYLTFTVPAKPEHIVLSKTLVAVIWAVIINILMVISIGTFVLCVIPSSKMDSIKMIVDHAISGINGLYAGLYVVNMFISLFSAVVTIFLAIAIGQLAKNHRVWASIGAYVGIRIALNMLNTAIMIPLSMTMLAGNVSYSSPSDNPMAEISRNMEIGSMNMVTIMVSIIESIIIVVVGYILICQIFKKKLNVM